MSITTNAQHFTNAGQTAAEFRRQNWHGLTRRAGVIRTGVASNDTSLKVTEKSGTPNMSVDVAGGTVAIPGTESGTQGIYLAESGGVTNVAITASDPTNPRIDLIVARVKDQDYASGSPSTNTATLEVITGTPAGSPALPSLPDNCVVLAQVAVAASASSILDANITDKRFTGYSINNDQDDGSIVYHGGVSTGVAANPPQSKYTGMEFYATDTGVKTRWNGSAWKFVDRDADGVWGAFTPSTAGLGTPTLDCSYTRIGDTIHARYNITMTGAGSATTILLGLPVTASTGIRGKFGFGIVNLDDVSAAKEYVGVVKIEAAGTTLSIWPTDAAGATATVWTGTSPITLATSDTIGFSITYSAVPA